MIRYTGLSLALLALAGTVQAGPVEFNRDIRPIFSEYCFACHGPDTAKRKAGLRLDTAEGGKTVLVAGKPDESELFRRLGAEGKEHMPPPSTNKNLSAAQLALIRTWIEQGAVYQDHWSFIPPRRPAVPAVRNEGWVRTPIDRFLLARLEAEKLTPAAEADRRTLLRRLYFDLLGLPPSPEEVEAFLKDNQSDAYEKVVDLLLESKHHGERLALFWLDLVRYGDTGGYHSDNHRDIYLYRDWVIDAFNSNKRFDRFTVEQLAGDLLPEPTRESRIASGYNRLLMTTEEGGAQPREYTAKYAADRVRNASAVWLGLTMGCAECHNHKYDPLMAKEFYQFAAFWADVSEVAVGRQPQTRLPTAEQQAQMQRLDEQIAAARRASTKSTAESQKWQDNIKQLTAQREAIEKSAPETLISTPTQPRTMRVLPRGNWLDETGEVVTPGTPASLPPLQVKGRANRLDLARWLTAPEHPLTARVFVNRLWRLFYGQGLVSSLEDFGSQGTWPSHPELLDWLAVEFRESGWDVRHLIRLLVRSSAYRMASSVKEEVQQRDPGNRLLSRQARFRLDAELIRDNALAVSGLLSTRIGGPSVKPYQPAGYWAYLNFPTREWVADTGANQYRRGLYTYVQRTFPHPSLIAFDASSREECMAERVRSNTPQQALVLLNDPTYVEAARVLAEKVLSGASTDAERLTRAYRQVLGRSPRSAEAELLLSLLQRHRQQYANDRPGAEALLGVGFAPVGKGVDRIELAAWTSVTRVLLNLHETITRE